MWKAQRGEEIDLGVASIERPKIVEKVIMVEIKAGSMCDEMEAYQVKLFSPVFPVLTEGT